MRVLDIYQFTENGQERFAGTKFSLGKDKYLGKSHGVSYLHSRKMLSEGGIKMGLDSLSDWKDE